MKEISFSAVRRRLLKMFGLAVTGTAVVTVISDKIFAKQFLDQGPSVTVPEMVYDPDLQLMVDPLTRQPIYKVAKTCSEWTPVVTNYAGCKDCPKGDGHQDTYNC